MLLIIIYLYVASGSIWPGILCHVVNNLLSLAANLLPQAMAYKSFIAG
ncbi:hypothetical protein [Lacimicrobium sp. SS2-24]|nr:hypothetical protein [Lacimicrobium sp. SS2-24]